jgi:hypothetical protein
MPGLAGWSAVRASQNIMGVSNRVDTQQSLVEMFRDNVASPSEKGRHSFSLSQHADPELASAELVVKRRIRVASYVHGGQDWSTLFRRQDKDNSGALDEAEFQQAVRRGAGVPSTRVTDEMLSKIFCKIDDDRGGTISLPEFLAWAEYTPKEKFTEVAGKKLSLSEKMKMRNNEGGGTVTEYICLCRAKLRAEQVRNEQSIGSAVGSYKAGVWAGSVSIRLSSATCREGRCVHLSSYHQRSCVAQRPGVRTCCSAGCMPGLTIYSAWLGTLHGRPIFDMAALAETLPICGHVMICRQFFLAPKPPLPACPSSQLRSAQVVAVTRSASNRLKCIRLRCGTSPRSRPAGSAWQKPYISRPLPRCVSRAGGLPNGWASERERGGLGATLLELLPKEVGARLSMKLVWFV